MPTYKNNTSVNMYVPEEVKAGETRTFPRYLHGTGLTLQSDGHLDLVLAAGSVTISTADAEREVSISENAIVDISVACTQGQVYLYFNSTDTTPIILDQYFTYSTNLETELVCKLILVGKEESTKAAYSIVRSR